MNIKEYIDSGALEAYVLGSASEKEARELLDYKERYPEVKQALFELEVDMERIAQAMAIKPPPTAWQKIEDNLNELIKPEPHTLRLKEHGPKKEEYKKPREQQFIEVEAESNLMRINKAWKWVFAAVFVLGKIFLGFAIYFYLENRQAQKQLDEMKIEMRQLKSR
ncbi:hypothetical protein [Mucilaginibacter agri]|uniref:Anti-sigma factor n=1 Tax=Mucilaginibacter agri TaxID=2695265 RepID=A0A965ZEY4_9SPHI|nr:hypothetical protein [Mucilaginibacter agri]NCD68744.1 hypothetical protein [Mucilaginibacter agri]